MSPTRPDMQKEVTIDPWGCCPRYHVSSWTGLGIGLGLGLGSGSGLGLGLEWRSRNCHVTVAHIGVCGVM